MAIRDVVVLNTTASRLETQQSSDTVRILRLAETLVEVYQPQQALVMSMLQI